MQEGRWEAESRRGFGGPLDGLIGPHTPFLNYTTTNL